MPDIQDYLNGATRVHIIVGDPIAQVKSPAGVTQAFNERGHNAIVMPAHVSPADLKASMEGLSKVQNIDGIIVTVPHKFATYELCATASERSHFLRATNTLRRNPDGTWHGDMFDGLGYVTAMRRKGCDPAGRRVLLVGAGGAGSAIAHALVEAGASVLAIHDEDCARRERLIERLASLGKSQVQAGSPDPSGFDIVLNATPVGMREGDPIPVDVSKLPAQAFVGDVITAPAVTPLIEAARAGGRNTMTGGDMFACVRDLMVAFLLREERT